MINDDLYFMLFSQDVLNDEQKNIIRKSDTSELITKNVKDTCISVLMFGNKHNHDFALEILSTKDIPLNIIGDALTAYRNHAIYYKNTKNYSGMIERYNTYEKLYKILSIGNI